MPLKVCAAFALTATGEHLTRSVSISGPEPGKTTPDLIHLNEELYMRVPTVRAPRGTCTRLVTT
jgi:hypothetical protein